MTHPNRPNSTQRADRRQFLAGGISLVGAMSMLPRSARGMLASSGEEEAEGRSLVLVQLAGGNDGLSTVVPYADDAYGQNRSASRIATKDVLRIDDYRGLHPNLSGLRGLYDQGRLGIIEGVGFAGKGRSHFKSFEVWHAAHEDGRAGGEGWLAKLAATAWPRDTRPELMVHVGEKVPYSLYSAQRSAVAFEVPATYRWIGEGEEQRAYRQASKRAEESDRKESVLDRLRAVHRDAQDSSARIRMAVGGYHPAVKYPDNEFGTGLRTIAALINANLGARVLSIELTGFDTHRSQKNRHSELMRELDKGLTAFLTDLRGSEAGKSALVMVFSEFGRRVAENGSAGTDHGKAGPMFVAGHAVRGGLYGKHPSLTELNGGDLDYGTDFRSVYATAVEAWFGVPQEPILGKRFEPVPFLRRRG